MDAEAKRRQCEIRLSDAFSKMQFQESAFKWLPSPEFDDFMKTGRELIELYQEYDTFADFNVEVISLYRLLSRRLRDVVMNSVGWPEVLMLAAQRLNELENWMDELEKEAFRNLGFMEAMNGEV